MKRFQYLALLVIVSCGVKHTSVNYGKTTAADLISQKGEPLEKKTIPIKDGKIYQYEGNEKYQIQGDVVTHGFKDPVGSEKALLYWKHRFESCETTTKKIKEAKDHQVAEFELNCPKEGISVIYFQDSGFVSRIIEHEKK